MDEGMQAALGKALAAADAGPVVKWAQLDQSSFDELVETLIHAREPAGSTVQVVDGRGGDGGIDILVVRTDGWKVIYQLKCFSEGIDGRFKDRRSGQIEPSLKRALKHNPDEWVLVAPYEPTPSDWTYLNKELPAKYPGVKISLVDRAELNGWVADNLGVVKALHPRDDLLWKAAIQGLETAVLTDPSNHLTQRINNIQGVKNDVDPNWDVNVTFGNGRQVHELVPRHPRAHEVSPVTLSFGVRREGGNSDVDAFVEAMSYGTLEPVRLPGSVIENFTVTGTQWMQHDGDIDRLEFHPIVEKARRTPVQIDVLGADGEPIASHEGHASQVAAGSHGLTFRHVFYDLVTITWKKMPYVTADAPSATGGADLEIEPFPGADPSRVRLAARLLLALHDASDLRLSLTTGESLCRVHGKWQLDDATVEYLRSMDEFVADLTYVQDKTGAHFTFPESVTDLDRVHLRVMRRIEEGGQVYDPLVTTAHVTVSPELLSAPHGMELLNGEPVMFFFSDRLRREVCGRTISPTERVGYVFRSALIEDPSAVRAGLERGENVKTRIVPDHGEHAVIYMLGRLPGGTHVAPEPWGLRGVAELSSDDEVVRDESI
ncbi:hypothetical protein [Luteipulveratus halotolerans]|uniref:Uncharacterized protein n=1 Tax=Luteipulveratus halotolerans TaxID=1631356 RepID=A0A0L6CEB3_9MICO|nr:hypothetical protein [Luteipulveratus halotolerans]KNX35925.1 hypothetical protein VV01_21970 [Luteipulveratus halotolerans]